MADTELVIVDTNIWVPYFNRPQSTERKAVDILLDDDQVAILGSIVMEVLIGFRRDEQADWTAARMRGLRRLDIAWDELRAGAALGRQLKSLGHTDVSLTDLSIAAIGITRNIAVYSSDPHFDLIPSLKRFNP